MREEADTLRQKDLELRNLEQIKLSLVVPVYNESETVGLFLNRVKQVFDKIAELNLDIVFVNDGSTDNTLKYLVRLQEGENAKIKIRIVDLSRNFGKEAALSAGLKASSGQVVVPIDVDLQHPPELILRMIQKWREGFDVVVGKRINRSSDPWAQRKLVTWFYRIHNKIAEIKVPGDVGDFRLMDRVVVDTLNQLPESRRFMKGLFAWVGFQTTAVEYSTDERVAGSTKFNGWRLWNLALEGITSFSISPLKIWTYIGGFVAVLSFILGVFTFIRVLIHGIDVPGYASVMITVTFVGGLQLIGIGIIGEYLGRCYIESKRRPVYVVKDIYELKD